MNLADKNKVLIAGGIAVVAILLLVFFMTKGGKKGRAGAGAEAGAGAQGGAQVAQTTDTVPPPGQQADAPGVPGEQPAPTTRLYGAVAVGSGQISAPTRPDFLINLEPPPPMITPEERTPLPPVITVAGGLRPGGASAGVTETIANRRVAGVKFDGGAWAILEKDGEKSFVVKPGDVIEGTKITAIARDCIYVVDPDGQPWQVPLRGAGPGGATPVTTRVPGLPEIPG